MSKKIEEKVEKLVEPFAEQLGYELVGVEYEVKKGETFYLKGNLPHYLMNKNDTLAKVIWVSTPPIF